MKSLALLSCIALSLMCPMDSFGQTSPTELREAPPHWMGIWLSLFQGYRTCRPDRECRGRWNRRNSDPVPALLGTRNGI